MNREYFWCIVFFCIALMTAGIIGLTIDHGLTVGSMTIAVPVLLVAAVFSAYFGATGWSRVQIEKLRAELQEPEDKPQPPATRRRDGAALDYVEGDWT